MQLTTLPIMGAVALLVDGAGPTQVAAALDIPTTSVKELASSAVAELLNRANTEMKLVAGDELSRTALWKLAQNMNKFAIDGAKTVSWLDLLTDVEHVEVVETRAYFRAFRNSKLNLGVPNG